MIKIRNIICFLIICSFLLILNLRVSSALGLCKCNEGTGDPCTGANPDCNMVSCTPDSGYGGGDACVPEFSGYVGIIALIGAIIIPTLIHTFRKKKGSAPST